MKLTRQIVLTVTWAENFIGQNWNYRRIAKRRRLGGVFKRLDFALLELKVVHLSISQGSFEPDRVTEMSLAVFDD